MLIDGSRGILGGGMLDGAGGSREGSIPITKYEELLEQIDRAILGRAGRFCEGNSQEFDLPLPEQAQQAQSIVARLGLSPKQLQFTKDNLAASCFGHSRATSAAMAHGGTPLLLPAPGEMPGSISGAAEKHAAERPVGERGSEERISKSHIKTIAEFRVRPFYAKPN